MNTENNKIIGDFMQWKTPSIIVDGSTTFPNGWEYNDKLKYHSDWNWLMEVVEKIESFNYDFKILGGYWVVVCDCDPNRNESEEILESFGETKINTVYNACVEFINWHNKQKS
ncbi:MAG: hypothetical protein H7Y10_03445 [Flavobacterium sp.]|nr:hypothetical protein [Flavobacterium sp.]